MTIPNFCALDYVMATFVMALVSCSPRMRMRMRRCDVQQNLERRKEADGNGCDRSPVAFAVLYRVFLVPKTPSFRQDQTQRKLDECQ